MEIYVKSHKEIIDVIVYNSIYVNNANLEEKKE